MSVGAPTLVAAQIVTNADLGRCGALGARPAEVTLAPKLRYPGALSGCCAHNAAGPASPKIRSTLRPEMTVLGQG
jgi:hypothetical protein